MPDILHGLKDALDGDATVTGLLPGLVWTRPIKPNAPGELSTPGATPAAFDGARIKRCASITPSPGALAYRNAPPRAYFDYPEIHVKCLPHETEKALAEEACREIIRVIETTDRLEGLRGEGLMLSTAGLIGPFDDPVIANAMLYVVRVQVDGIWKF